MTISDLKLCVNCDYHSRNFAGNFICNHPCVVNPPSPVDGFVVPRYCGVVRLIYNECGPDGKYFRPRRPARRWWWPWSRGPMAED